MSYESKSDEWINNQVVSLINKKNNDGSEFARFFADALTASALSGEFDPCNDAGDAWPIILENKISIEFRDHKSLKPVAKRFGSNSHNIADENPLRAAMVVFLMMSES